ncbi:MAG: MerR family transcriptional regulator [Oscillospiraceae bacterium]|nr:MerR family transcriptional regulator [Oscillospiraceae bacterium]
MKIKDVEKLTGLSQKSIRLYESKGLLKVNRKNENDYRDFTEENVEQLRFIRLLRYLDFSISEIAGLMDAGEEAIRAALEQKIGEYGQQKVEQERKVALCRSLSRDLSRKEAFSKIKEEYLSLVDTFQDEEFLTAEREWKESLHPSLGGVLVLTLVLSGPILGLFWNISDRKWDGMLLAAGGALVSALLVGVLWTNFIIAWLEERELQKKRNKGSLWRFPVLIVAVVLTLLMFAGLSWVQQQLLCPEGWLFYAPERWSMAGVIVLGEVPLILVILGVLGRRTGNSDYEVGQSFIGLVKRWWKVLLPVWMVGVYLCLISVNVVMEDEIIRYSPLHPLGQRYSYADVERVEAGYRRKGEFYYKAWMGKVCCDFSEASPNEAYPAYEDTYLELEELDVALMQAGAEKTSDGKYQNRAHLDQRYLDRFQRILNNGVTE